MGEVPAQGRAAHRLRRPAGLGLASTSEIAGPAFSKPLALLRGGVQIVKPARPDECCGFGGTFSVTEEPVSARMGYDKVNDHLAAGAEYIVTPDPSCMMQKGCAERLGLGLKFIHHAGAERSARMKRVDHARSFLGFFVQEPRNFMTSA